MLGNGRRFLDPGKREEEEELGFFDFYKKGRICNLYNWAHVIITKPDILGRKSIHYHCCQAQLKSIHSISPFNSHPTSIPGRISRCSLKFNPQHGFSCCHRLFRRILHYAAAAARPFFGATLLALLPGVFECSVAPPVRRILLVVQRVGISVKKMK